MSTQCLRSFSLNDLLQSRLDFTSGGQVDLSDPPPSGCKVLKPERILYDKSSTGSPISSSRGERQPSCSASSSCSSPMSYTQDLLGVESPGLSGAAFPKSPLPHKSPLAEEVVLHSSKVAPAAVVFPPKEGNSARRSRFDIPPPAIGEPVAKKPRLYSPSPSPTKIVADTTEKSFTSLTVERCTNGTNGIGKKRALEESETEEGEKRKKEDKKTEAKQESDSDSDSDSRPNTGVASILKRIKEEATKAASIGGSEKATAAAAAPSPRTPSANGIKGQSSTLKTESRLSSTPPEDAPVIGPQLPPSLVKVKQEQQQNGGSVPQPSPLKEQKALPATNGASRKRLLSERGETELCYPVIDDTVISKWTWAQADTITGGKLRATGLVNRSNDCFLNVILQMVTHTAPLARYIVSKHHSHCAREHRECVACGLRDHIIRVFKQGPHPGQGMSQPITTNWIRPHLNRIFPSHMSGMQEDAHELLSLLLDAIDPPVGSAANGSGGALPPGMPNSKLKASTPIEQMFGGTLRNQVTCKSCSTPYINYERIRELNLAITKRQDEKVKMETLIEDYFRKENIPQFCCKKCGRKTAAERETRMLRAPALLLIQLKRFNAYGGKIRAPVQPDTLLDLRRYSFGGGLTVSAESSGGSSGSASSPSIPSTYQLHGIVEHLGSTVDHGHYVAYSRGTDGTSWWKFDDEQVTKTSLQRIQVEAQPYLLIYTRRDHSLMTNKGGAAGNNGTAVAAASRPYSNGYGNGMSGSQPSLNRLINSAYPTKPTFNSYGHNGMSSNGGYYKKPNGNGASLFRSQYGFQKNNRSHNGWRANQRI